MSRHFNSVALDRQRFSGPFDIQNQLLHYSNNLRVSANYHVCQKTDHPYPVPSRCKLPGPTAPSCASLGNYPVDRNADFVGSQSDASPHFKAGRQNHVAGGEVAKQK